MNNNKEGEFLEFDVNKAIVGDLIHSQNGTLATAIRELVMNSIDALSQSCHILLGPKSFGVADSGKGFVGRDSVEFFFKNFGHPHKEGDAIFGRFRIGRGQIMSFGKIIWHSNEFKMITDVRNKGNGFQLIEDFDDKFAGCKVTGDLHEEINSWDLSGIKTEIENLVRYADQEVTYNGMTISQRGNTTSWDYEDEDIMIKWDPDRQDGINLYSLGIYVKEVSQHYYGINADIVTKKALKLNMARNEISDQDMLWKKISKLLKERSIEVGKKKARSKNLDEVTRRSLIRQYLSGDLSLKDAQGISLLRDCRGHSILLNRMWSSTNPVTVSPCQNNRIAERLAASKTAMVLHYDELRIWNVDSIDEIIQKLRNSACNENYGYLVRKLDSVSVVDFNLLASGISDTMTTLKLSDLNPRESAARNALDYASGVMSGRLSYHTDLVTKKRKIVPGDSDVAHAWTDAVSYIAINKNLLKLLDNGYYGAVQLSMLMLHEYCHEESDLDSHEHNFNFYEKYHDLSFLMQNEVVGHTATSLFNRYISELGKKIEVLPKEVIKNFKWPAVNDTSTYIGIINGKKLSKLAICMLDGTGGKYKSSKTKLSLTLSRENEYDIGRSVNKAIIKAIQADGFETPDYDSISLINNDYKKRNVEYKRQLLIPAIKWAEKNNHDIEVVTELINASLMNILKILRLICLDSNSELISFETSELYRTRIVGSKNHTFNFKSRSENGWSRIPETKAEILAEDENSRWEYALKGIKDIVNGITDQKEKDKFIKQYLTQSLSIQIDS